MWINSIKFAFQQDFLHDNIVLLKNQSATSVTVNKKQVTCVYYYIFAVFLLSWDYFQLWINTAVVLCCVPGEKLCISRCFKQFLHKAEPSISLVIGFAEGEKRN